MRKEGLRRGIRDEMTDRCWKGGRRGEGGGRMRGGKGMICRRDEE